MPHLTKCGKQFICKRILIKALATLPPRLGMAEYGLGNGFKGKAFIKKHDLN